MMFGVNTDKSQSSPLLEKVLDRKQLVKRSRWTLWWGCINLTLALAMLFELKFTPVAEYFSLTHPVVWYTELCLTILFSVNSLVDLAIYIFSSFMRSPIPLSPNQKKLLGVQNSDRSFTSTPKYTHGMESPQNTSQMQHSPLATHKGSLTNLSTAYSPSSHTPSPMRSGSYSNLSQQSMYGSPGGSFLSSSRPGSNLSGTPSMISPMDSRGDTSGLRSRHSPYRHRSSADSCVSDERSLKQFLDEQEEKDMKRIASESSPGNSLSFWNFNRSATDYTPILRKYQYQVATRNAQSSTTRNDDDPDHPAKYAGSEVWAKLSIDENQLDRWTGNLRYWLSQTIFVRLVKQIGNVNSNLRRIGCSDMLIGDVSISTLKQLALTKSQHVPNLNNLIPYLEMSSHQEYLIHRITELGKGGCMSDYDWNGGGDFKGKPWADHLPTDAAIVLHVICTYFDARLPPNPRYPDGRVFTTVHFVKTPDKPVPSKSALCLYQSRVHPAPHFKVIIGEDTWDSPKGRNNLFHALLLFLHHIKVKEHGMLGPINLGLSGVNILWVLED